MKKVALAVLLFLAGCAHAPPTDKEIAYKKALNAWVGQDVNRAFEMMGPPTASFQMPNGRTQYTWEVSGAEWVSSLGVDMTKRCKTIFTATPDGLVDAIRSEGKCGSR